MRRWVGGLAALLALAGQGALAAEDKTAGAAILQSLRSLADHGDLGAQVRIGRMYETGDGIGQDVVEAGRWYRMAAELGNRAGQAALGRLFAGGLGLPQDLAQAYFWLSLAVRPPVTVGEAHDWTVALRDEVATKLAPDQRAEAERLARNWSPR
jgi:TPR repeat protein